MQATVARVVGYPPSAGPAAAFPVTAHSGARVMGFAPTPNTTASVVSAPSRVQAVGHKANSGAGQGPNIMAAPATPRVAKPLAAFGGHMPSSASKYRADDSDRIDVTLAEALRRLDSASAEALLLCRLTQGKYEIDGRRVTLDWDGPTSLSVYEDDVPDCLRIPLLEYLQQAATVARVLADARAAPPRGPSFLEPESTSSLNMASDSDDPSSKRIRCMIHAFRERL